ncbi:PadR family transcriptional regulator [Streptodolium elevatio]|uniref:PadR family transcriptional regulator n=1 Tax=Streptodolium elevatio TaxID=3157996 RepID=A0ABV3DUD0_9ACTN
MLSARPWLHGFLDLCLLAMLQERPDYGYGLAQRLSEAGVAEVPGGTLYPALLRLEQHGLAEPTWAPSESGPRRKYYALTPAGRQTLAEQATDWARFRDGVDALVGAGAVRGQRGRTGQAERAGQTGKPEQGGGQR